VAHHDGFKASFMIHDGIIINQQLNHKSVTITKKHGRTIRNYYLITMKLLCATPMILALLQNTSFSVTAFTPTNFHLRSSGRTARRSLLKSTPSGSDEKTRQMMAAAAAQMKNITPEDLDKMVSEVDSMNPLQAKALKAMGMDPEMMKKTMTMMRDNPAMVENAKKGKDKSTTRFIMF